LLPAFPAIAAFVASIVGYPIPVVCQPLPQGTTITYQASDQYGAASITTPPVPAGRDVAGMTFPLGIRAGDVVTVSVAGQTVTLPAAPSDTPATQEQPSSSGYVFIPVLIAIANCDDWTSDDPTTRGDALLTAIHESMHAKYADGNEALTECRAMQALPTELASLWPGISNPGTEPTGPSLPVRSARWRKIHHAAWRRLLASYRTAFARWLPLDTSWQRAYQSWETYQAILYAATAMDASEPPQYHGATC